MLIKPDLKDEEIVKCLHAAYGLRVKRILFLPLGADLNTAVYRVTTNSGTDYFLKLRREVFNEAAVLVPNYLAELGLKQVVRPLKTNVGQLWTCLVLFKAILYPYIEGSNAMEANFSDQHWIEFGAAMKKFIAPIFLTQ